MRMKDLNLEQESLENKHKQRQTNLKYKYKTDAEYRQNIRKVQKDFYNKEGKNQKRVNYINSISKETLSKKIYILEQRGYTIIPPSN